MYLLLGISTGFPIRIKNSIETRWTGPPIHDPYTYDERYISSPYFVYFQAVGGIGGYIRINKKNAVFLEGNIRIGMIPVLHNESDIRSLAKESRTLSIQLILGYLRHFKGKRK